ncbi:MAG: hypothetical protein KGH49_01655 [Candidatus Micrarchaeota archaeon]|nr:hypothetical protein [Candidatus Micrarchaeota archaeon]
MKSFYPYRPQKGHTKEALRFKQEEIDLALGRSMSKLRILSGNKGYDIVALYGPKDEYSIYSHAERFHQRVAYTNQQISDKVLDTVDNLMHEYAKLSQAEIAWFNTTKIFKNTLVEQIAGPIKEYVVELSKIISGLESAPDLKNLDDYAAMFEQKSEEVLKKLDVVFFVTPNSIKITKGMKRGG